MKTPQLIFKYAGPLDRNRRALFEERKYGEYPTILVVRKEAERIKKIWSKINKKDEVIKTLTQLTDINLDHDLEMYLFGFGFNPMSFPLMMPVVKEGDKKNADNEIIEIVIHELCHRFAADQEEFPQLDKYWMMINKKYKNENKLTRVHIIVYALLDVLLKELFPSKIEKFMKPTHKDYMRALAIVREVGAENILGEFRKYTKV